MISVLVTLLRAFLQLFLPRFQFQLNKNGGVFPAPTSLAVAVKTLILRVADTVFREQYTSSDKGLTSDKSVNIPLVYPTLGIVSWPELSYREGAIKLQ